MRINDLLKPTSELKYYGLSQEEGDMLYEAALKYGWETIWLPRGGTISFDELCVALGWRVYE